MENAHLAVLGLQHCVLTYLKLVVVCSLGVVGGLVVYSIV